MERKGVITIKGNPLTLIGKEVKVGQIAPGFTVIDRDLKEVTLANFSEKVKIFSVTPSLDTPVCDAQARKFNKEAANLPGDVIIINMSMDLPFALKRFCADAGIDRVITLSDHREASFGENYGVLIKELRLLARSIFIVDREDVIRYVEIVPEVTNHPYYEQALSELRNLL